MGQRDWWHEVNGWMGNLSTQEARCRSPYLPLNFPSLSRILSQLSVLARDHTRCLPTKCAVSGVRFNNHVSKGAGHCEFSKRNFYKIKDICQIIHKEILFNFNFSLSSHEGASLRESMPNSRSTACPTAYPFLQHDFTSCCKITSFLV